MIDLDSTAQQYREASHYWQRQWNAVVQQAKDRENELLIELKLTRQQWETESLLKSVTIERLTKERDLAERVIAQIKSALGTEECEDALVEVARNAHSAEIELASIERRIWND